MDIRSVSRATCPDTREVRALRLYRERGDEIVRTAPFMYNVPSSAGDGFYVVNYRRESCECLDFTLPRRGREPGEPCKHILAVGVKRAKRRGGRR